jgi:hypothetical protein
MGITTKSGEIPADCAEIVILIVCPRCGTIAERSLATGVAMDLKTQKITPSRVRAAAKPGSN